jgi:SAM-dependent methyltransferase
MTTGYVHGHSALEHARLVDQARAVAVLLHHDTCYPAGARVLEAGCGVGAQTVELVRRSPAAEFVSVDISAESLERARRRVGPDARVRFERADVLTLSVPPGSFDHAFVCFFLEHLAEPAAALAAIARAVRPGGTITLIEGDHGSCYFSPDSAAGRTSLRCLVDVQASLGGDALIGRRLHALARAADLGIAATSLRTVYSDGRDPEVVEGFVRRTLIAMIEGVREQAIALGLTSAAHFDEGIADLRAAAAAPDATFVYSFFKVVATRGAR